MKGGILLENQDTVAKGLVMVIAISSLLISGYAVDKTVQTQSELQPESSNNISVSDGKIKLAKKSSYQFSAGRFQASSTGVKDINDVGFEPDLVIFRITTTHEDWNTERDGGKNTGWGHGYAVCQNGSCNQSSISIGSGSSSTNQHDAAASSNEAIHQVVTSNAGDNFQGFITGNVTGTDTDGFNLEFKEVQESQYISYQAYKFPESSKLEVGTFNNPTSTGQKTVTTGFQPDFALFTTTNTVEQMDWRRGTSSGTYGWSHGVAAETDSGLEQRAMSISIHSSNTNGHASASSDSRVINQLYTGQDGNIQDRSHSSVSSFDSDGFTLDYSTVNTNTAYPVLYVALKSPVRKEVGNFSTPNSLTKQTVSTGFEPDSVSTVITNFIPNINSEQESGSNQNDNTWAWYFGSLEKSYQQNFGFSSHSNSMNGHASSATESNLFRILYTDVDGYIQDEDIGSGSILKDGFEIDWSSLSSSSTTEVPYDQQAGFYWAFSNRYEPSGNHDTGWINTDLNASWQDFSYETVIDSGIAETEVMISRDGQNTYNNDSFTLTDGISTESLLLGSGNWIRFITDLERQDNLSPAIKSYTGTYKSYNTSLNPESDYSSSHKYDTSVDVKINGGTTSDYTCEMYYKTDTLTNFIKASSNGGTAPTKSISGDILTCDSVISKDLSTVRDDEIKNPVEYFFRITDSQGVITDSKTSSQTLPNSKPTSTGYDTTASDTAHEFDFTGNASDPDGESDFQSCNVRATDGDVSTPLKLGDLFKDSNGDNEVSCKTTISDQTSSKFEVGETITVWAEFTDVGGETVETTQTIATIPNSNPSIEQVPQFSNNAGEHSFDVTAEASDPEGDSLSCTVTASDRDGNERSISGATSDSNGNIQCSTTISDQTAPGFDVGDIIDVSVQFSDDYGGTAETVTNSNEIPNTVPLLPSGPSLTGIVDKDHVIDHTPVAEWNESSDPEGDNINYTLYIRESGGTAQEERELEGITSNSTAIGNTVSLENGITYDLLVESCDPYGCSDRTTYTFTMNTPPIISGAGLNTSEVTAEDQAEIEADINDPEDSINTGDVNFTVKEGGVEIINGTNTTFEKSGLFVSENFTVEDLSYTWNVSASDGYELSFLTGNFEPGNSNPVIEGTTKNPASDAHSFNVSAKATDADSDDISGYNITITDGTDIYHEKITDTSTDKFAKIDANTYYANFSNIDSSLQNSFKVGDSLDIEIRFFDIQGATDSATVSQAIPNKAPSITRSIENSNPETAAKLVSDYTYDDPENDDVAEVIYRWFRNAESTSFTSANLSSERTSKGEDWSIRIQVKDEFGAFSTENFSSNVTIKNSPPEITSGLNYRNVSGHKLELNYTGHDFNGDSQTCEFIQGGSNAFTGTEDTSYGNRTEFVCSIILDKDELGLNPLDPATLNGKTSDGSTSTSTAQQDIRVPNMRPEISLDIPEDGEKFSGSSVNVEWIGEDSDGDNLEYEVFVAGTSDTAGLTGSSHELTGLTDGNKSWYVEATDSNQTDHSNDLSTVKSQEGYFLVDTNPPTEDITSINVIDSSRSKPLENQSVEITTQWFDNEFDVTNITIYDEASGENLTFDGASATKTITGDELMPGDNTYRIYANDNHSNVGFKEYIIDAEDIYRPNSTPEYFTPNTTAEIDPGKTIEFFTTAEDNLKISNVEMKYRKEGDSWKTGTASGPTGQASGDFTFSFTPSEEGFYNYSLQFTDPDGNANMINGSLDVFYDYNWNISTESYEEKTSTLDYNRIEYKDLKITNPGDSEMNLQISNSTDDRLKLNISKDTLTIPVGETKSVDINASLNRSGDDSADEGSYEFELNLDTVSENRTNRTVTGSAFFTLDAPFLDIRRNDIPLSVETGSSLDFSVVLENLGPRKADNTWLAVEAPEGFTPDKDNYSIGNLTAETDTNQEFTAEIGDDAETGTYALKFISRASNRDRTFTNEFIIDVVDSSDTVIEEGGGGVVAPSGPSSQEEVESSGDRFFNTTESFDIVRGQDQNFSIGFENPTEYNLTNISIEVSGIQSQYLNLKTDYIDSVNVNSSENITVDITAPEYFQTGDYTLNFNITGKGEEPLGLYTTYFDFNLEKQINLGVKEISRDNASEIINESRKLTAEMNSSGLTTERLEERIADAEEQFESGDYGSVKDSYQRIEEQYSTAKEVKSGIEELEAQIDSAQAQGLSVGNSRRVTDLARAAMERGAYSTAEDRLEEAQNIYQLQTAGEVNWIYEIRSNWKKVVAGLFIVSISGFLAWIRYRLYRINRRLVTLEDEEQSIEDLKLQAQKKAFEKKEMSLSEYGDATEDYNDEIVDIIEERVQLETARANITNFKKRDSLAQERDKLSELIKETQEEYVEGDIGDSDVYDEKVEELTERLSEVEGEIAEIDARAEVRSKHTLGRIIERMPIVSSGGVQR